MFWRLLWRLLRGSRGRLAVALVALISGAAVISALLNLDFDISRKLTQEFRTLGANLVITPSPGLQVADSGPSEPVLMGQEAILTQIAGIQSPDLVAAAPYLYVVARAADTQVVVAGTWLDQSPKLNPTWKLSGAWIASREDSTHCLIGQAVSRQLHLSVGRQLDLENLGRSARLIVAGIVDAGGTEDNQVFVNLPVAQSLADEDGRIGLVLLSIGGPSSNISRFTSQLQPTPLGYEGYDVRPIRQVTEAEGSLLNRIRLLIASMVLLILALSVLCVLATMAALAMERRADVGLMKALGGSISRIVGLFLAEVGVLGAAGGLIGCFVGVALSVWMGHQVFGASISPRWEVFPLTIALMTGVALAGALPLRRLGKMKPAVILRGE
jgi:putative ABC transport system permease protein